jgi:hypothetical protein
VRSSEERGTTRSSGLPTTSTGGAPTGLGNRGWVTSSRCAFAPDRVNRCLYASACSAGNSALNSWRRLSRSRPPNTAGRVPNGLARNAAPNVAQPSSTGAQSTAARAG